MKVGSKIGKEVGLWIYCENFREGLVNFEISGKDSPATYKYHSSFPHTAMPPLFNLLSLSSSLSLLSSVTLISSLFVTFWIIMTILIQQPHQFGKFSCSSLIFTLQYQKGLGRRKLVFYHFKFSDSDFIIIFKKN